MYVHIKLTIYVWAEGERRKKNLILVQESYSEMKTHLARENGRQRKVIVSGQTISAVFVQHRIGSITDFL